MLNRPRKKLAIILVLMFSVCLVAQEKDQAEKEEKTKYRDNDRVWEQAIPVYTFSQNKKNLFDFGSLRGSVREGPGGTSALDLNIRLKSFVDKVSFSFYIRPTIYGSPGLDGFALPRMSLNMDPVTGWYYWDF